MEDEHNKFDENKFVVLVSTALIRTFTGYILKVHECRFGSFTVCSGSYENNTLKMSHS